ncbi:MAG: dTMP kinase [Thiohalomonadales bacterium]
MKAKFITLEGIEGSGKSTAIRVLSDYLKSKSIEHVITREPGGTAIGEQIRGLLLDPGNEKMVAETELLLMFAARAQHLFETIKPALASSKWVLCDRFTDATYAYQGGGRQQEISSIATLEKLVQGALRPDLVLVLDVDPQLGMQRVDGRGNRDRFEHEKLRFFEAVREVYLQRAQQDISRYAVIDACLSIDDVNAQIRAAIERLL